MPSGSRSFRDRPLASPRRDDADDHTSPPPMPRDLSLDCLDGKNTRTRTNDGSGPAHDLDHDLGRVDVVVGNNSVDPRSIVVISQGSGKRPESSTHCCVFVGIGIVDACSRTISDVRPRFDLGGEASDGYGSCPDFGPVRGIRRVSSEWLHRLRPLTAVLPVLGPHAPDAFSYSGEKTFWKRRQSERGWIVIVC